MSSIVDLKHMLHRKLGVALRRREPFVSEHFLDGAKVGTLLQHVRAESMAQRVRVDVR